jgi:hypothetical protein
MKFHLGELIEMIEKGMQYKGRVPKTLVDKINDLINLNVTRPLAG